MGPQTDWNAWVDASYLDISDERYDLSTDGHAGGLILGIDRLIQDGLVVGLAAGYDDMDLSGYANTVDQSYDGYYAGPFFGYRIDVGLVIDGWVAYGKYNADSRISVLDGGYDFSRFFGSLNLTGQYLHGDYRIRPKLTLFYAREDTDDYELAVRGVPGLEGHKISFSGSDDSYGLFDASVEVNRLWPLPHNRLVQPYGRFGIRYDFERPNGGELITPDLRRVTPSAWSGSAHLGVKALVNDRLIIDASANWSIAPLCDCRRDTEGGRKNERRWYMI